MRQVREFLLSMRCALHLVSGRSEERLLFQHQSEVAKVLRVTAQPGETDTEALLRRYFQEVRLGRRTVDEVLERMLQPVLPATTPVRDLGGGYAAIAALLFARDHKPFVANPARMVEVVRLRHEEGLRLSPRTRSSLHQALASLPVPLHDDESAARALRQLAASRHCRGEPFGELLELGVLPVILRDIERLAGRFKQDGYHAYPTDEHLCRCVDMALRVSAGVETPPDSLRPALARTTRFDLLVLGALFHDLGKGLPGDHAKVGAELASRESKRMGLTPEEREVLVFLVEEHLVLSWASQRRDLSDPSVIEDIARRVQTVERLDLLALLTWVDIASVAPGMMTDWKGRLLGLATEQVRQFLQMPAQMNASPANESPVAEAVLAEGGHAHMVRVICRDRRGLLGDLARALSSHGANVLHAHVDAREDGIGFDAFRVDDGRGRALHPQVLADVLLALRAAACGEGVVV
ncbi:MAG: HD domain-containing protein, partial [Candidatus Limnocylindrus sp.]